VKGVSKVAALLAAAASFAMAPAYAGTRVVVTIKPVHALVAAVMRGVAEPKLLVKGSSSPHTYALAPSDAAALNDAAVLFRVSPLLEPFTLKIVAVLPPGVRIASVMEAPGLRLLGKRRGPTFDHDAAHSSHLEGADGVDGHAWLDPDNAGLIAIYVAEVLSGSDPMHAPLYHANAESLRKELRMLAVELERALKPVASRAYIVFHDAMQYFERRFGLNAVGSISVSPEVPPSAKRLLELRRKLTEAGAVCAFAEPRFNTGLVSSVVENTGVRVGRLDPEAVELDPGPQLYFNLMRSLAADLTRCLAIPA